MLVGHSMGYGDVARYAARHGKVAVLYKSPAAVK